MKNHVFSAAALFALVLAGCASVPAPEPEAEIDPAYGGLLPGSVVNWIEPGAGFDSAFKNIVIARGSDYTIFYDPDWAEFPEEDDASSYGVEFSGVVYFTCDEPMPTLEERQAMAGLADMAEGEVLSLDDTKLKVKVGGSSTANINGVGDVTLRDYTIYWIEGTGLEVSEPRTESVSSAEEIDLVVMSDWNDTEPMEVVGISVASEAKALSPRHAANLGNCASVIYTPAP